MGGKHHSHKIHFLRDIGQITKPIAHEIQKSYPRVSHDLGSILKGGSQTIENVTSTIGHTITSTSSSLSIPLAIGGCILVAFIIYKNK